MRLLVLRFSSMGDVALLAPVLTALASEHSNLSITLVTRKIFEPFFYNIPGVSVIGVDLRKQYRGLYGLYRLYRELRKLGPYSAGIDVHGSLRSRILKFFFFFSGVKFDSIVKGRREKRAQTRRRNKVLKPLPHMVERYMRVFERSGLSAEADSGPWINPDTSCRAQAKEFLNEEKLVTRSNYWIGIAPFAGHANKTWPLSNMHELFSIISREMNATLFLFGGGKKEIRQLEELRKDYPDNTVMVAGKLSLEGEMALFLKMNLILAMDSFNMHLAALLGVPLLSIWGPTHPYSGFGPYGYTEASIIQVPTDSLTCRPCSIFGNKPCFRKDLACMNWITPRLVFERVEYALQNPRRDDELPQTD